MQALYYPFGNVVEKSSTYGKSKSTFDLDRIPPKKEVGSPENGNGFQFFPWNDHKFGHSLTRQQHYGKRRSDVTENNDFLISVSVLVNKVFKTLPDMVFKELLF